MKLYKNCVGKNVIDLSGEISFSLNEHGIEIIEGYDGGVMICNKRTFHIAHKKWKITRFIYAASILWKNI